MRKLKFLFVLSASIAISSLIVCTHAYKNKNNFIQCHVLSEDGADFVLYTDIGNGFNEANADRITIKGASAWQSLKFKIKNNI